MNPGDRVRIVNWAEGNIGPYAQADRRQLVGLTGHIVQVSEEYVSVKLEDDPSFIHATVLAIESELEVINDAVEDQANAS